MVTFAHLGTTAHLLQVLLLRVLSATTGLQLAVKHLLIAQYAQLNITVKATVQLPTKLATKAGTVTLVKLQEDQLIQ